MAQVTDLEVADQDHQEDRNLANEIRGVNQGDVADFVFDRDGESISDWVCTLKVKQFPTDTSTVDREIEADNGEWPGFLTKTETAALTVGVTYSMIGVLTNATTGEKDTVENESRIHITADWDA